MATRDESALHRQWVLLKSLSSRRYGLTVREMAADLGVNVKTVRRDLDLFRAVGFPLEATVGERGRKTWQLAAASGQPPLGFGFDEVAALYLGRRLLEPLAGTVFWEASQRAHRKIQAMFDRRARDYLDRFAGSFHHTAFGTHDYARRSEPIDALQIAIEDEKTVHILYASERSAGPSNREVHPYGLVDHRGSLYLVAFDPARAKVKHYKVDRIESAEVGASASIRPEGFDLAAHLASSLGVYQADGEVVTVRVRFDRSVSRFVRESRWHHSQRLTDQPDGSLLAEFRLSSTEEIKRWLMGFGAGAVVLGPERLRREIVAELRELLAAYETPAPDEPDAPTH